MNIQRIEEMATRMRRIILDISHSCDHSAHIGGGLSIVDIMATLYGAVMQYDSKNTTWKDRDRFILSKGHGALGYYSALAAMGTIPDEVMATFQANGSDLTSHPVMNLPLGIESSNGSLGQGLSMAVGLALAAKRKGGQYRIYVLLGNGECNEGAVWEAVMAASHLKLDNLTAIVDNNGFQNDGDSCTILDCGNVEERWASFGWNACSVNGHDIKELYRVLVDRGAKSRPKVVIADTIKGKGVSFMEDTNDWHHNRLTRKYYDLAIQEVSES
jgi:transketolase